MKEQNEVQKYIKKEARNKTIFLILTSVFTSLVIPLVFLLLFPKFQLTASDISLTFLTKGTFVTIVISHVVSFITYLADISEIFYTPKLWKSSAKEIDGSYTFFIVGAIVLLLLSVMLHLSFLSSQPQNSLKKPIIFSCVIFVFDIVFNYKLILKKESQKEETKYNKLVIDLENSQEKMKNSNDLPEFEGGKL
jgi:hypothetical protein